MANIPVALQLYTVRDDCAKDFPGTVKQVADIGYAGVELAGMHGLSAAEVSKLMGDLGLEVAAFHTGIDALSNELDTLIEDAGTLGCKHLVCSYMPEELRKTAADWQAVAMRLSHIGQTAAQSDIGICYHNHSFEFERFDGKYGLDVFFDAACPAMVKSELDVYWVQHGGADPVEYMNKYGSRVALVHLKDMEAGPDQAYAEVGEGILDMPAIIAAAEANGSQWLIVEQDVCKRPPIESARLSFENLRKMGKA